MGIPGIPQNMQVQTGNQQVLISWNLSPGATSYQIQRSLDNVTYTPLVTLSGSPLATSYVDAAVTLGTQYWYQVAAVNISGSSPYTQPGSAIPAQSGETSLAAIRLAAKQRADRVNSNFVSDPEWNTYINTSMYELYDLLITVYEDYYLATPVQFPTNGNQFLYPLPDGTTIFTNFLTQQPFAAPALYKLQGVDLALQNTAPSANAFVTVNKFNFIDRNRFVYPNTASTIYGVFNLQYRMMGSNIEFIPTPSANQNIRLWYIPRLTNLLKDTDTTTTGISGWTEYIVVKAAYYALTKEESDTSSLVMQLQALTDRIISSASNRDAGQPDKISDTRVNNGWNGNGSGWNGSYGGF
jgi:hypothetical protein